MLGLFLAVCPVVRIGRGRISEFNNLATFQTASPQFKGRRCLNIDRLSIAYAYRPRLRIRLTLGGLTWPRKPGVYGERVSHPFYRYSCLHKLFQKLHASLRSRFSAVGILSYHSVESAVSAPYLAPLHFRRGFTRPVSYYAFFKGWLLLSQPPGCLCLPTSFPT